jgi:predicted nucleic acid-binding protein
MTTDVLLDTNVILDFALKRAEHYVPARKIMCEIADGRLVAHVSASQITDIYYFLAKKFSQAQSIRVISDLIDSIQVIGVDKNTIEAAMASGMTDFEDAVQVAAAKDFGIEIVITRDKTGFHHCGLQAYTPEEFLATLE